MQDRERRLKMEALGASEETIPISGPDVVLGFDIIHTFGQIRFSRD